MASTQTAFDQAVIDAGIGLSGTLIINECKYALYVSKAKDGFFLMAFDPAGYMIRHWIRQGDATKPVVDDAVRTLKYYYAEGEYVVLSGGEQVKVTESGDGVELSWNNFRCGWNSEGKLIIVIQYSDTDYEFESYRYIGYVKDDKIFFDENCGIE